MAVLDIRQRNPMRGVGLRTTNDLFISHTRTMSTGPNYLYGTSGPW